MIKIKGTTVYPLAITNVLDSLAGIEDYIIILEDEESGSDRVTIHVATMPSNLEKIGSQLRARRACSCRCSSPMSRRSSMTGEIV